MPFNYYALEVLTRSKKTDTYFRSDLGFKKTKQLLLCTPAKNVDKNNANISYDTILSPVHQVFSIIISRYLHNLKNFADV